MVEVRFKNLVETTKPALSLSKGTQINTDGEMKRKKILI